MPEPISTTPSRTRIRTLLILSLFAVIAIPAALYLNKVSTHWIPESEAKVQAAKRLQAQNAFAALRDDALKQPEKEAAQLAYAHALVDRGAFVEALLPAERAVKAAPRS